MKSIQKIKLISLLLLLSSCVTQFIPKVNEDKELLVVEGLITDQPDTNLNIFQILNKLHQEEKLNSNPKI